MLSLLFVGAPTASATTPCDPCPAAMAMAQVGVQADPCCDHEKGSHSPDKSSGICKPGQACQAAAAALPDQLLVYTSAFSIHRVLATPAGPSLTPHPPERSLRPPITL